MLAQAQAPVADVGRGSGRVTRYTLEYYSTFLGQNIQIWDGGTQVGTVYCPQGDGSYFTSIPGALALDSVDAAVSKVIDNYEQRMAALERYRAAASARFGVPT